MGRISAVSGASVRIAAVSGRGRRRPSALAISAPAARSTGRTERRALAHRGLVGWSWACASAGVAIVTTRMLDSYDDGNGGHCLVGALLYLSRKHRLPTAPAIALLQDAMPRPGLPLVYFNDTRCGSVAEPRSVILRTRGLAHDDVERERAAAAVKTWRLGPNEE